MKRLEIILIWNRYLNLNWNREFPMEIILLHYVLYDLPVTPLLVYYRYFSQTVIIIPQIWKAVYLTDAEGKKPETAIELYAQAEQYLNNEGIFYPIYYEKRYYAIAPGLTDIIVHPYDMGIDFMHAAKT